MDMDISSFKVIEFVDNGYSGTNFERPQVQELLQLAQRGEVQIIICKDFSRFGRNSLEMGYFLEKVFPIFNVRFIAVSDNYDSAEYNGSTGGVDVVFKFLIHEQYSKDLSRKIKAAKDERQRRGEYIYCPYGYKKVDNKMVIDEPAADTVRWIFELAAKGTGFAEIRSLLYADNRLTPGAYKKGDVNYLWEKSVLIKILQDEQYIGTYVAGKTKKLEVGSKKAVKINPEDWIRIRDHHPAIIDKNLFDRVQIILNERSEPLRGRAVSTNKRYANLRVSPLKGKVYCGSCSHAMQLSKTKNAAFHCRHTLAAPDMSCHKLKIDAKELERKVLRLLWEKSDTIKDERIIDKSWHENEISMLEDEKCNLYDRLVDGEISKSEFVAGNAKLSAKIEKTQALQKVLVAQSAKQVENQTVQEILKSLAGKRTLTDEVVVALVDRARVLPDGGIEVDFKKR